MKKLLFILSFTICLQNALADLPDEGKFLNFSDIHFDPFYDTSIVKELVNSDFTRWEDIFKNSNVQTYGSYGKDSDYKLLVSALNDMKIRISEPDFIIITGDFMSHDFNENFYIYSGVHNADSLHSFIAKTMKFITSIINSYYPQTAIFPMVGNDDSDCNNYMIQPRGQFLKMLSDIWHPLVVKNSNDVYFKKYFPKGGYYAVNFPQASKQLMIVLNTVFFSPNYLDSCGNKKSNPGETELKWLESTLKKCKLLGYKAWLAYHIPPGVDIYGTIHSNNDTCERKTVLSMAQKYNNSFLNIIKKYSSVINSGFAGHFHKDDFRIIYKNNSPVSQILIAPSISPVYYNNPAYRIFTYGKKDFRPINYETYFLNLEDTVNLRWQFEYSFKDAYLQNSITPSTLNTVYNSIKSDTLFRKTYIRYYTVSYSKAFNSDYGNWFYNWCGIGKFTSESFSDCFCGK